MKEDARTFIISRLSKLVEDITELRILYKFDVYSREHLIKVLPSEEFKSNSNYHRLEEILLFEFIEKFPLDNLVFLTEGDWIDIKQHEIEFVGSLYSINGIVSKLKNGYNPVFNDNKLFAFNNLNEDFVNMSEILGSFNQIKMGILEPSLKINSSSEDFFWHKSIDELCFFSKRSSIHHLDEQSHLSEAEFDCNTKCDCDNFALAA
jgi:hypothetical protein